MADLIWSTPYYCGHFLQLKLKLNVTDSHSANYNY